MKFVIEHLEEELHEWCLIEYEHLSQIVGPSHLLFTNVKKKDSKKLVLFGEVTGKKVGELHLKHACLLDPYAATSLTPQDTFEVFIFGGILGDNPPKKRTEKLTTQLDVPTRNLGPKQMSTDTAVFVTKKISEGKKPEEFHFVDEMEIEVAEGESYSLPFRYVVDGKKPIISEKLIDYLKKHGGF